MCVFEGICLSLFAFAEGLKLLLIHDSGQVNGASTFYVFGVKELNTSLLRIFIELC